MTQFIKLPQLLLSSAEGAAGAEGLPSAYYSPAAVGLLAKPELQFTHSEWLAGIDYDYVALAVPLERVGTFFVGVTYLNSGEIDVRTVDIAVPHAFRIDHDNRTEFTAIQTSRGIDSHLAGTRQTQLLYPPLGIVTDIAGIALLATLPAVITLIGTEKNMILIITHWHLPLAPAQE